MSKFSFTNIAGEKVACSCTQYMECNMECSLYRKITGKQTNADRIRAMTDEELANEIIKIVAFCAPGHRPSPDCCCNCQKCWLDWLKSPVEEDE